MRPSNVRFEVDDVCSPWVYPEDHFDFIHIRGLLGSIADWPALYQQAYRHMVPGAYIEQVEWSVHCRSLDGSLSTNPVFVRWSEETLRCGTLTGKTYEIAENMAGLIREAGFVDVVEKRFKMPIGAWPSDQRMKDIGRWNLLNWEEGMEGWTLASYTRVLGVSRLLPACRKSQCLLTIHFQWTYAEVQQWLAEVRTALRDRKEHVYHEL